MERYLGKNSSMQHIFLKLQFIMMSLTFAVCIFYYAVIRYNSAAVHYDYGSLILEFALVSSLLLLILQLVVPTMLILWHSGRLFVLSRKWPPVHDSNNKNFASISVTQRIELNI